MEPSHWAKLYGETVCCLGHLALLSMSVVVDTLEVTNLETSFSISNSILFLCRLDCHHSQPRVYRCPLQWGNGMSQRAGHHVLSSNFNTRNLHTPPLTTPTEGLTATPFSSVHALLCSLWNNLQFQQQDSPSVLAGETLVELLLLLHAGKWYKEAPIRAKWDQSKRRDGERSALNE